jgi:hypothetical protein
MTKFSKHKWWIVTALITVPVVAIAAVPNVFTANTVISSAQVNANFAALDTRLAALEAATAKTSATVLAGWNNSPGPLTNPPKIVNFTASGVNPLLVVVSGSAYISSAANLILDVAVQMDGVVIGDLKVYTNELNSHKAFPSRAFIVPAPAAGNHNIGLNAVNAVTDANDFFTVTVVELH